MKKLIAIALALAMALALSLTAIPAMANTNEAETKVEVVSGGGTNHQPVIKAKWETSGPYCNSDDNTVKPGLQANPNVPQGTKTVYFWAVVSDPDSLDQITGVWVDLYKPDGTLKVQIELEQVYCTEPEWPNAAVCVQAAADADLLVLGEMYDVSDPDNWIIVPATLDDVKTELIKGEAKLYKGSHDFVHGQWGGFYRVEAYALDAQSTSNRLENCFEYVRQVWLEKDFTAVDFGALQLSQGKIVSGDEDLTTPEKPTLKNGGNVDTKIIVHFSPMTLRDPATGDPIPDPNGFPIPLAAVEHDARLGLLATVQPILPCEETFIGVLHVCNTKELDLSIHPKKLYEDEAGNPRFGIYKGMIRIIGEDNETPTAGTPCPPLP